MVLTVTHVLLGMSQNDSDSEQSESPKPLRTVSSNIGFHQKGEMSVIGLVIFVALFFLFLPLLPIFVIVWIVLRIFGR